MSLKWLGGKGGGILNELNAHMARLRCTNPNFTFQQHEKLDGESNGRWNCEFSCFDHKVAQNVRFQSGETVAQKKEAQEQAIMAFFRANDIHIDANRFRLGAIDRNKVDRKRTKTAATTAEELDNFNSYLAKPPGASAAPPGFVDGAARDSGDPVADYLGRGDDLESLDLSTATPHTARTGPTTIEDDGIELLDLGLEDELGLDRKETRGAAPRTVSKAGAPSTAGDSMKRGRDADPYGEADKRQRFGGPYGNGGHTGYGNSAYGTNATGAGAATGLGMLPPQARGKNLSRGGYNAGNNFAERKFISRSGQAIPEELLEIQGLWVLVKDPPKKSIFSAGDGTLHPNSVQVGQLNNSMFSNEPPLADPDAGSRDRADKIIIVEENVFRTSDRVDRRQRLMVNDDECGVVCYVNDKMETVKGTLRVDTTINMKTLLWSNGEVWEPAVTPYTPEEEFDMSETFGFSLENAKQNLNNFFQKKKMNMETLTTESLAVVPGFRASIDMWITPRERLRCGLVSASKKAASCELAMRVCKILCRKTLIAPATMIDKNQSTGDSIDPDNFGLVGAMRAEMRRFITQTCNFNPVEWDPSRAVVDVGLKIDAAPWSLSANYESEGAIAWTEPRACRDPWGGEGGGKHKSLYNSAYPEQTNQHLLKDLQDKQKNNLYAMMQQDRIILPIWNMQHDIVNDIEGSQVILVHGSTGCGKTTQIPQFILDYYIGKGSGVDCNIIVTQPRRVAAISVAERVAQERGEALGNSVGYMVRFDQVAPRCSGSICYMTVGVLLKRLAGGLHGISHVIVDEVHERDVSTDFLLIVLRQLISVNPRLKVILMSATMDLQKVQAYFSRRHLAKIIDVPGRQFPVTSYFLEDTVELLGYEPSPDAQGFGRGGKKGERDQRQNMEMTFNPNMQYSRDTMRVVRSMNENELQLELIQHILLYIMSQPLGGGVLIFLPGWDEIARCLKTLRRDPNLQSCFFLPLHSQVPKTEQHLVFQPAQHGRTKVVLATNIAETSVTIPDISYVIDSCKCKMKYYRPVHEGGTMSTTARAQPLMSRMDLHWAARHNLVQRQGRAGRTHSGVCFRLCSKWRFDQLPDTTPPEIVRVPLHQISLMVKWLRLGEIRAFLSQALDPPSQESINRAIQVLQELYAVDQFQRLTPLGVQISKMPIEPRMAYAVLLSSLLGVAQPMCLIAAASCYQDPVRIDSPLKQQYTQNPCYSDQILGLRILYQLFDTQKYLDPRYCRDNGVNGNVVRIIFDSSKQLETMLQQMGFEAPVRVSWSQQRWNSLQLLLAISLDHFAMHQGRRRVWLGPMETGTLQQASCCSDEIAVPPEKFYVFEEQTANSYTDSRTYHKWKTGQDPNQSATIHGNVQCRSITNLPVCGVILGASNALTYSQNHLYIDGWLPVKCSFETASLMGALKACLESLVLRLAHTPALVGKADAPLIELRQILLSIMDKSVRIWAEEEQPI